MRSSLLCALLLTLLCSPAFAAREIEPNNHWLQATLIDGTDQVIGALNDELDVYKLLLTEPGEITVTLDEFPAGANLTLEVLGFRQDPLVQINQLKSHGKDKLQVRFDAQEQLGYLVITATPVEKICKDQWCIIRLVNNGPYYLLKSGPTLPAEWNGQPIVDPPQYRLTITNPKVVQERRQQERARQAVADLPLFQQDAIDLTFHYPKGWQARTPSQNRIVISPVGEEFGGAQVVLQIRDKATSPGSSPKLQLNLAEKEMLDSYAHIIKRGTMEVAGRSAPYLLGKYPATVQGDEIAQLQLVLENGEYYFWISYAAPDRLYSKQLTGLATILKTLEFPVTLDLDAPKTPQVTN